jgi:hypothetical protein
VDPTLFVLDDFRDLLLGVEFERAGFDITYEHERRESEVTPFTSDRARALYTYPLGRNSAINLELHHDSIYYPLESNRWEVDRAVARWDQNLTPRLDFNLRLEYRDERDRLRGNTEGFDQIIGLAWHRGRTNVSVSLQNTWLESPSTERTSQFVQFRFHRDF